MGKTTATLRALPTALFHYRALQKLMNLVASNSYPQDETDNRKIQNNSTAAGLNKQNRFDLVDYTGQEDNYISSDYTNAFTGNRVKCFKEGFGCNTEQSDTHKRCLDPTGGIPSHKLSGASESIWEDLKGYQQYYSAWTM